MLTYNYLILLFTILVCTIVIYYIDTTLYSSDVPADLEIREVTPLTWAKMALFDLPLLVMYLGEIAGDVNFSLMGL